MSTNTKLTRSDLSTSIGLLVTTDETGALVVNTVPGSRCLGVLTRVYNFQTHQYGEYTDGPDLQKVLTGGIFAADTLLENDSAGRAVARVGGEVIGLALEPSVKSGDLIQYEPFEVDTGLDVPIVDGPAIIYVELTGNDDNPGTLLLPKRTITNAFHTAPLCRGSLTVKCGLGNFGNNLNLASAVTATASRLVGATDLPVMPTPVSFVKGSSILFTGGALGVLTADAPVGTTLLQFGAGIINAGIANGEQGSAFWDRFSSAALMPDATAGRVGKTILEGTLQTLATLVTSGPSVFTNVSGGHAPAGFVTIPIAGGPFAVNQFQGKLVQLPGDFPGIDREVTSSDANNLKVKIALYWPIPPTVPGGSSLLIQQSGSTFTFRYNEFEDPGSAIDASGSQFVFKHFNPIFGDIIGLNGDDCPLENGSFRFEGCHVQGDDLQFRNTDFLFLSSDIDNFAFIFAYQNGYDYSARGSLMMCTVDFSSAAFGGTAIGGIPLSLDSCWLTDCFIIANFFFGGPSTLALNMADCDFVGSRFDGTVIVAGQTRIFANRCTFNSFTRSAIYSSQGTVCLQDCAGIGTGTAIAGVELQDGATYVENAGTTLSADAAQLLAVIVGAAGVQTRAAVQAGNGVVDLPTLCRAALQVPAPF